MEQTEILVKSTSDSSIQPSLFYKSETVGKRPLLVGLHTWSWDRFNQVDNMVPLAEERGFHILFPEFRGPNLENNPNRHLACGSEYAKQDIKDAIDYCIENYDIDTDNIFLLGGSGGGHMALMMAGFCPEYFKAIASFVPITDLKQWTKESAHYGKHVIACCGEDNEEMRKRSPMSRIDTIAKANVKIFHGKFDPIVPYTHSLKLYNEIFKKYPKCNVYLDIFDGGHELDKNAAMYWILSQYKKQHKTEFTG